MLKTVVLINIFVETYDNTIQKFGASKIFFLKEKITTFIQRRCIKLIKSDSKDIYNVTKDFYFK